MCMGYVHGNGHVHGHVHMHVLAHVPGHVPVHVHVPVDVPVHVPPTHVDATKGTRGHEGRVRQHESCAKGDESTL